MIEISFQIPSFCLRVDVKIKEFELACTGWTNVNPLYFGDCIDSGYFGGEMPPPRINPPTKKIFAKYLLFGGKRDGLLGKFSNEFQLMVYSWLQ